MPKAVATKETERYDLQTCSGGFVELRKFTYGEVIKRRELSTSMKADPDAPRGQRKMEMGLNFTDTQLFEFKTAIVSHNLEDEDGRVLNFQSPQDVMKLDPGIAQEIEVIISNMNRFDEEFQPNPTSPVKSSQPSTAVQSTPK